jgi:hypothetical protein
MKYISFRERNITRGTRKKESERKKKKEKKVTWKVKG